MEYILFEKYDVIYQSIIKNDLKKFHCQKKTHYLSAIFKTKMVT